LLCTTESRATGGTGYTLTAAADDSTEAYDASGRLLSIKARNGWLTTLTYSDATTPTLIAPRAGLLISVKNHFGRELRFTYDAQGRIAEVLPPGAISGQPAGSATSPIRYVYNEPTSLGTGVPAQSQLTSVVWQDGATRRYHHEDARWPQAVTGITDEAGVRYGTYAYDDQGRVTRSELAGGAERLDFAYSSDASGNPTTSVTDYSGAGGAATSRSYTFTDIANVRYPASLTAPCSLCGSTQQASSYDTSGNPTKQIAHDGSVTFFTYDARGRETERATFPSSHQSATTRPALGAATKVISTKWHATFNLPTQVAEPNKTTANTYNSKGMLTGQSWTATTDATGAAKFSAVKTGSTYATGWGYSASSLATTVVQKVDAVEVRRWAVVYNALGDATKVTHTEAGTSTVANLTSSTAHGLLTQLSASNGAIARFTYNSRNQLATAQLPDYGATMTYDARALLTEIRFSASSWLRIVYDQAGNPLRLEDSAGQSQLIVGLAEPSGLWPRSRAVADAAGAKMRALLSALRDPATATRWLPLATAKAQTSTAAVPARILQGMSLAQTQQQSIALDIPNLGGGRACCTAGGAGSGSPQTVKDYLNKATIPINLMTLSATLVSEALSDEILMQKSAYKLRKNLCAAGVNAPEGCHHAHHIVAVGHPRAATSRTILANAGMDVNDACNGMFVPCDQHGRLHTHAYYDKVDALLRLTIPGDRISVCSQLTVIRANIASGNFP
jgi:YD repeat-containing protein